MPKPSTLSFTIKRKPVIPPSPTASLWIADDEAVKDIGDHPMASPKKRVTHTEDEWRQLRDEGSRLASLGKYSEADDKWNQALLLRLDENLLEMKAQAFMETASYYKAIQAAQAACNLRPQWHVAYQTLGRAQLNMGELELAIESFEKAVQLKDDFEEVKTDDLPYARALLMQQKQAGTTGRANVVDTIT